MAVSLRTAPGRLEPSAPSPLFTIPITLAGAGAQPYSYDAMPDGQRFLALVADAETEAAPMTILANWQADFAGARK